MSQRYEIIWGHVAEDDLSEIVLYIAETSVIGAKNTLNKIKTKSYELTQFPNRGRIVPELKRNGVSLYRELIIDKWRLIYRVTDNQVLILTIIDSRRNIEDILLNRFIRE